MNKELTKEEYLNIIEILAFEYGYLNLEHVMKDTRASALPYQKLIELINKHFELKEIIKKHGLENLTLHELDCAFKKMLGYVQENNRLMNLLTQQNEIIKEYQNGEAYKELKRSYDELLGHAVAFQEELINLKDNPPLKFEELHEKMWVWDNRIKAYLKIQEIWVNKVIHFDNCCVVCFFQENRLYRYEVKENENAN